MSVRPVYRVWVCYGTQGDNSMQVGNPALRPAVYREDLFGDFSTEVEAGMRISNFLARWTQENPKKSVPSFKIIEHQINENNQDLFFNNSNYDQT
mgnify:CR=1 FL=1